MIIHFMVNHVELILNSINLNISNTNTDCEIIILA